MNQYISQLNDALRAKNMIVLYRDELGGAYYAGIPAAVSPQLAVLNKEDNFRLDGYVALRPGDITCVEQYDDNDFCRRALEGEGVYAAAAAPDFPCGSWQELFDGIINSFGGWCSVECEAAEQTVYYVGRITKAQGGFLTMQRVDADGHWHDQPAALPYDEITLVTFGDNYLQVFHKYCK